MNTNDIQFYIVLDDNRKIRLRTRRSSLPLLRAIDIKTEVARLIARLVGDIQLYSDRYGDIPDDTPATAPSMAIMDGATLRARLAPPRPSVPPALGLSNILMSASGVRSGARPTPVAVMPPAGSLISAPAAAPAGPRHTPVGARPRSRGRCEQHGRTEELNTGFLTESQLQPPPCPHPAAVTPAPAATPLAAPTFTHSPILPSTSSCTPTRALDALRALVGRRVVLRAEATPAATAIRAAPALAALQRLWPAVTVVAAGDDAEGVHTALRCVGLLPALAGSPGLRAWPGAGAGVWEGGRVGSVRLVVVCGSEPTLWLPPGGVADVGGVVVGGEEAVLLVSARDKDPEEMTTLRFTDVYDSVNEFC